MEMSQTLFLTKVQVATATGTSLPTVNRRLKDGTIPFIKLGARVLVPASYLVNLEHAAQTGQGA